MTLHERFSAPAAFRPPVILGIVNITEDSFSDGGKFLDAAAAIAHGEELAAAGADGLDLGAAASNIASKPVAAEVEITRLAPVVAALKAKGIPLSVDTFSPAVQRWALAAGVDYLNDIQGFPDAEIYPDLAAANAKLIVMHSVQGRGRATVEDVPPDAIMDRILKFFAGRIAALERAGVARTRLILDPGMGFFLSANPETSLAVLRRLGDIKRAFGLPVLAGLSRKSFLRKITGRETAAGAATLSGELLAVLYGADYIRTHDAGALADGLKVFRAAAALPTSNVRRRTIPRI
jgi:dihydropteroate synthase type 2